MMSNNFVKVTRWGSGMHYFYQKNRIRTLLGPDSSQSLLRHNHQPLALATQRSDHLAICLLGCDFQQSSLLRLQTDTITTACYLPYGYALHPGIVAFQGEYLDPVSKSYPLGAGYRSLIPTLHRLNSPDNLSPFDRGGINAYAFVSGDPVNYADPSGHAKGLAHLHVPKHSAIANDAGLTLFTNKSLLGKRTLYVIAHGSGSQAVVGGRKIANSELFSLVQESVKNLQSHDDFFMNICTSADLNPSTGTSLGQDFANHFNLGGIAFSGNVKGNLELKTTEKGTAVKYEVEAKNYLRPGDPGYDRFNYKPIAIRPDLSAKASSLRAP
ncbi:RHS repeat-associated core domain-containing protein [Pseudomonas putida]|nr:RHS repeat-associated core domain-containing protein [Pseudomonas putida]